MENEDTQVGGEQQTVPQAPVQAPEATPSEPTEDQILSYLRSKPDLLKRVIETDEDVKREISRRADQGVSKLRNQLLAEQQHKEQEQAQRLQQRQWASQVLQGWDSMPPMDKLARMEQNPIEVANQLAQARSLVADTPDVQSIIADAFRKSVSNLFDNITKKEDWSGLNKEELSSLSPEDFIEYLAEHGASKRVEKQLQTRLKEAEKDTEKKIAAAKAEVMAQYNREAEHPASNIPGEISSSPDDDELLATIVRGGIAKVPQAEIDRLIKAGLL